MACHLRRSWLGPEPDRRNFQDRPRLSSQIEATPTTSDHDPALVRHLTSRPNRVLSASKKARERFKWKCTRDNRSTKLTASALHRGASPDGARSCASASQESLR